MRRAKRVKNSLGIPFINTPFQIRLLIKWTAMMYLIRLQFIWASFRARSFTIPFWVAMNSSLSSAQKRCALALFLSVRSYRVHSLPISSISFRFLRLISMVYCLSIRTHTQTPIRSVSLRWSAEASEQRAAWVKRTQHHYMFNGMRLFVWPKKMEIRFICWIIPKLCVCGVSGGSKSEMFTA